MKILGCDLDGTLVEYPFIRRIKWNSLRVILLGIVTWLDARLQLRLAEPTPTYKKVKELKVNFVVVSGRTEFLSEPYRTVVKLLNYQPQEIYLRTGNSSRIEYKKKVIQQLQKKYEVVAFIEDEPKVRRKLRQKTQLPIIAPDPEQIEKLNL